MSKLKEYTVIFEDTIKAVDVTQAWAVALQQADDSNIGVFGLWEVLQTPEDAPC